MFTGFLNRGYFDWQLQNRGTGGTLRNVYNLREPYVTGQVAGIWNYGRVRARNSSGWSAYVTVGASKSSSLPACD